MKNILITGAEGFIGSHLTELLVRKGYNVTALVNYNSFNDYGWLKGLENDNLNIVLGDIRDLNFLKGVTENIDFIFHLAALIAIPYSYNSPYSYFETNLNGTYNICQASLMNNNIPIIVTSTSEVYGSALYTPIDEKHPKQPQSPYSASKISADALALSYFNSFDLKVSIFRPFNTFGPRQSLRAVIPSVITQTLSNNVIKIGNTNTFRDFNYVKDTAMGFYQVMLNHEKCIGKEINFCTSKGVSINDLINKIIKISGKNIQVVKDNERIRPINSEVDKLLGDNSLFEKITGIKMKVDFEGNLKKTFDWYSKKENLKMFNTNKYVI